MAFRPIPTQGGYRLSEVISALQKEIRRGNEREAMFWALELIPRYERYLWRRLLVIVNEDIGIANLEAIRMVPELRRQYFETRAYGTGAWKLVLANCILLMSRSDKCRAADYFQCCVVDERGKGLRLKIPDYSLCKHTLKGKQMGRGFQHWFDEGCKLVPEAKAEFETYRDEAEKRWKAGVTPLDIGGAASIDHPEWDPSADAPLFPKFLLIDDETLGDEVGRKTKKK
jgi:replication-associated recombination protein RarA